MGITAVANSDTTTAIAVLSFSGIDNNAKLGCNAGTVANSILYFSRARSKIKFCFNTNDGPINESDVIAVYRVSNNGHASDENSKLFESSFCNYCKHLFMVSK